MKAAEAAEHNRKAWARPPGPDVTHDRCLRRHAGRYGVACHHCADWIAKHDAKPLTDKETP